MDIFVIILNLNRDAASSNLSKKIAVCLRRYRRGCFHSLIRVDLDAVTTHAVAFVNELGVSSLTFLITGPPPSFGPICYR